jgi:ferric-dicitrate binding protein FerR (iron transport regulator)
MNIDYRKYNFEDFALDEQFRKWVLDQDAQSALFWQKWIAENPDCEGRINLAKAFLYALEEKNTSLPSGELDQITEHIAHQPDVVRPFWQAPIWRVAASILVLMGLAWTIWTYTQSPAKSSMADAANFLQGQDCIEKENSKSLPIRFNLEDGSEVTLYPHSTLCYPKSFTDQKREVYLSGQAFFHVAHIPSRPFWVYTNKISAQALGTSFMVKSFPNVKEAKVEVKTGKVSVYTRHDLLYAQSTKQTAHIGIILTPNQEVAYAQSEQRLVKALVAQPEALMPVAPQEFKFDEAPINDVFGLLERIYGVTMIYDSKVMSGCYLTTDLTNESLYEKLDLISKITHSHYEIVDAQIIIHSKGCQVE